MLRWLKATSTALTLISMIVSIAQAADSSATSGISLLKAEVFTDVSSILTPGDILPVQVSLDIRHKKVVGATLKYDIAQTDDIEKMLTDKYGAPDYGTKDVMGWIWGAVTIGDGENNQFVIQISTSEGDARCIVRFIRNVSAKGDPEKGEKPAYK